MRLTEINIDGFGMFTGYTLAGLRPGVNIIAGENEAGKSTLLQFIRFTLFGYPRPLEQRLPPLFGGRHGGRAKVLMTDGTALVLDRTAGYPGDLQLHAAEAATVDPEHWSRLIGHASGDLYENVYAISLTELADLESLSRSGVEDRIFSLGLGLKSVSVNDIERSLTARMEAIYKHRGSKQQAVGIWRELEEHNRKIAAVQLHLPRYQQLSGDIDRYQAALAGVKAELDERQSRYERLKGYEKCYPSFVVLQDADRELSRLPEWQPFPDDGPSKLERLEQEEARLRQELAGLRTDLAAIAAEPVDVFDQALAGRGETAEYLSRNLEKYKTWAEEHREDRRALDELDQAIGRGLAAIQSDWTEDHVLAFTDMVSHRDRLTGFSRRLNTLQSNRDRLDAQISLLQTRRSAVHIRRLCALIAVCLFIGSAPLIYDKDYVWAGTLIILGLTVFVTRKLLVVDDPLKEALQASVWLEAEKARTGADLQKYLADDLALPPNLSPEAALTTLTAIERLGRDMADRDGRRRRALEKEQFLRSFESALAALEGKVPGDPAEADTVRRAARVLRDYQEAVKRKNTAEKNAAELARLRAAADKTAQALARVEKESGRLLSSIQADSRDDFRQKYRLNQRVNALVEQRRQALRTIEQIAGVHDSQNLIAYFTATEKPTFEKELAQAGQALRLLQEQSDEWNRKISADLTLRDQLRDASNLAEIMTRVATCRERLTRCHREWLAAGIARHVLRQVKQQYEQQKQPAVIRHSSDFFQRITGGRYQRIQVSLEDERVLVFDESGAARRIDQLSRGTREQLLVSIRLGFITEYEKKSEPLPLILDDVLVNFDRRRAERTAAILHEFSAGRQTLLFTCHPETAALFGDLPVNRITLEN